MKKILALLPLIGAFVLTGCGGEKEGGEGAQGEKLPYTEEQVRSNVKNLGENDGYELSCEISSSSMDEKQTYTVGMKGNFFWYSVQDNRMLFNITEEGLLMYTYDDEQGEYEKGMLVPASMQDTYEKMFESYGNFMYVALDYQEMGDFTKVKETTFLGRAAIEYKCVYEAAGYGKGEYVLILDKALGITLKWSGSAVDYQHNESGSGTYEVKSFKTGSDVSVPKHPEE